MGDLEINISTGSSKSETDWKPRKCLYDELERALTNHKVGPKDGPGFTPATLISGQRKKENVKSIGVMVLDIDAGYDAETVAAAIQGTGYTAIMVSTHSHGKTETMVSAAQYEKWQKEGGTAESFLIEKKGLLPHVAQGATVAGRDGDKVILRHNPCPKWRIVFFLAAPINRDDFESLKDFEDYWKALYTAIGTLLGLQYDKSCSDLSRFFYGPRHPQNPPMKPESRVFKGTLIDHSEIVLEGGITVDNAKSTPPPKIKTESKANNAKLTPEKETEYLFDLSKPGNRYSDRVGIDEIHEFLRKGGWQLVRSDDKQDYFTRPGKNPEEGISATLHKTKKTFYVFTDSAPPFEPNKAYTPFALRALIEFNGDFGAATRAVLAEERLEAFNTNFVRVEELKRPIEEAIKRAQGGDPGAPLDPIVVSALAEIREIDRAEYVRLRNKIKRANPGVLLRELDHAINEISIGAENEDQSIADIIVDFVQNEADLFHDGNRQAFALFQVDGHREVWSLESAEFEEWVRMGLYRKIGKVPRAQSVQDAVNTLRGIAIYDGEEEKVWLRVGRIEPTYYLDLCNEKWQVIKMNAEGWEVLDHSPIKFRRTSFMAALPIPERSGDVERLWEFVNLAFDDRPLALANLLESLRPETDKPVFEIGGEQGSGKSIAQEFLRNLNDPSSVNLRSAPKSPEDIFVAARNNWIISYNNMSHLTSVQQDALCAVSTGGGFGTRKFYTNEEEVVIEVKRPVMMNGISNLATAQDLVDRTIRLTLSQIKVRRKGSELREEFEKARPQILGGLLDLFCNTLKAIPEVELTDLPRMADFALLGEAMQLVRGDDRGFSNLYRQNREATAITVLESSPAACAVLQFAQKKKTWEGTYRQLGVELITFREESDGWPKSSRGLADALRRAAPALRLVGVEIIADPVRKNDGFHLKVKYIGEDIPFGGVENIFGFDVHDVHDVHHDYKQEPVTDPKSSLKAHTDAISDFDLWLG